MRKLLCAAVLGVVVALVVQNLDDLKRYLRIRRM
ncbi:DUF6893 family small protein [Kitasatospora sp. NPDC057692]